jgi:hypothetical protein
VQPRRIHDVEAVANAATHGKENDGSGVCDAHWGDEAMGLLGWATYVELYIAHAAQTVNTLGMTRQSKGLTL